MTPADGPSPQGKYSPSQSPTLPHHHLPKPQDHCRAKAGSLIVGTFPKDYLHRTPEELETKGPTYNQALIFPLDRLHHSRQSQPKPEQRTPRIAHSRSVSLS